MKELPYFFIGFHNDEKLNEIFKQDDLELFKQFIEPKIQEDKITYNSKEDLKDINNKYSIFIEALLHKSINISDYLLKNYPDLIYIKGYSNESCLEGVIDLLSDNFFTVEQSLQYLKNKYLLNQLFKNIYDQDPEFHLNHTNQKGDNLLAIAVQKGNKKIAKFLLNKGFDINFENKINGNNLLHIFASNYKKEPDFFSFILKNPQFKHNINDVNYLGETPLLLSLDNQNLKKAKFLIQNGSDILIKNSNNQNALHYFCKCKHSLTGYFRPYSYYKKIKKEHTEFINFLLEKGIDINNKDDFGNTPILSFAQNVSNSSRMYFIRHLYNKGADLNVINNEGNTILHYLTEKNKFKELNFALNKTKLDINIKNNYHYTPLMMLFKYEYFKDLKDSESFIKHYNSITWQKENNKIIKNFHLNTSEHSTESIFKYLLSKGANKEDIYAPNLLMPWFEDKLRDKNFFQDFSPIDFFEKMNFDFNRIVNNENKNILIAFLTNYPEESTLEKKLDWIYEKNINFQDGYQYIKNVELQEKYLKLQINKEKELLTIAIQDNILASSNKKTNTRRL